MTHSYSSSWAAMASGIQPCCAGYAAVKCGSYLLHHHAINHHSVLADQGAKSTKHEDEVDAHRVQNQMPISSWSFSRRRVMMTAMSMTMSSPMLALQSAEARERRSRKTIPLEDYLETPEGLKYYDVVVGKGPVAEKGSTVQVHFDCIYRGITAISSRESKLLAGNRIIAQPYEFKVGSVPGKERKRDFVDNPNGLFSAQAAPKPPPAMYTATTGMRVGGKRTVIVTPEVGYGEKGMGEIPPGATFDLNIELLELVSAGGK
ncbi:hypothetical protein Droror1_Dr00023652 [Drosera rotundifolia]